MGSRLEVWEKKLHGVLQRVDVMLENEFGDRWPLHPARPPRGTAANPQYDGLFRLTASFSAGIGSELGPGYVFRVEMVTLSAIPTKVRQKIETKAVERLRELLPEAFPGRQLEVDRDGNVFKIYGDLTLS